MTRVPTINHPNIWFCCIFTILFISLGVSSASYGISHGKPTSFVINASIIHKINGNAESIKSMQGQVRDAFLNDLGYLYHLSQDKFDVSVLAGANVTNEINNDSQSYTRL